MMSMINPNADTPVIKMMMSEKITTKVDAVLSATLIGEQPASTVMDIAPTVIIYSLWYSPTVESHYNKPQGTL